MYEVCKILFLKSQFYTEFKKKLIYSLSESLFYENNCSEKKRSFFQENEMRGFY